MAFASNYERIQQRLHQEVSTGPYHPVSTDKDTKLQSVDTLTSVTPASVVVGETATAFGTPQRNRRTDRRERRTWRWQAVALFNQNVSWEAAEKRLIQSNIILARDTVNDRGQVTLKLLDADPFHPLQQDPSSGTQVTLTFEAEVAPV